MSPAKQARYLTQAVELARGNPRVTMLLWFLVRDETEAQRLAVGARDREPACTKPAFAAFVRAASRRPSSSASSAFWTCRRFSASSQIAERAP